jgi:Bacterial HORMA domain 2
MSTAVYAVATSQTHVAAYLTDKMLLSLGYIIRDSGLSMEKFSKFRDAYERGIKAWLLSGHLETVVLEIYDPTSDVLLKRWDFELAILSNGDLGFSCDPADIRYYLQKSGKIASQCGYRIVVTTKPGRPPVSGWSDCTLRDTSHLKQFSIGTTISAGGSAAKTSYWR